VFNAGNPSEFLALNSVNLFIEENQVTVLKGPSGSGKTTLLSIVGCMSLPSAGRVKLQGREITSLPERFLTDIRRKTFGFIFQQPNLIKGISVLDNVMLPAYPLGEKRSHLKNKAMKGLAELIYRQQGGFEGGVAVRWGSSACLYRACSDQRSAHYHCR
jgi:putative ABC transport system ATP-binding protein